jgi:hypothetical protein
MIMETVLSTIGYAFIALALAGLAYGVVQIFTKLHNDDDDD